MGTLTSLLAISHFSVVGVEQDQRRYEAASRMRKALNANWPAEMEQYTLVLGTFPTALAETDWLSPQAVLVFTNCAAAWPPQTEADIVKTICNARDVVLDSRLFGQNRHRAPERNALLETFEAQGMSVAVVPASPRAHHFYHLARR
jgi:hypothetical protein